jgi:hypothetical protein
MSFPSLKNIILLARSSHAFTASCSRQHAFVWHRNTRTVSNISACDRQRVFTATRQCRREFYTSDPVSVLDNCLGSGRCRRSSELVRSRKKNVSLTRKYPIALAVHVTSDIQTAVSRLITLNKQGTDEPVTRSDGNVYPDKEADI